jgi:hypothetical protein
MLDLVCILATLEKKKKKTIEEYQMMQSREWVSRGVAQNQEEERIEKKGGRRQAS